MSLKRKLASFVGGTFVPELFKFISKGPKIVFYHGVSDEMIQDSMIQANQMCFEEFKKQIDFLQKEYVIISIEEFAKRLENESFIGNEVVITFDDGYRNNLTIVGPYLKEKNIPFTVFVCPELSSNELRVPTYYIRLAIFGSNMKNLRVNSIGRSFSINNDKQKKLVHDELISIIKSCPREDVLKIVDDILKLFSKDEMISLNNKFATEALLSDKEIVELAQNYPCTIASHSLDHTILHSNQKEEDVLFQLGTSREKVKELVGFCDFFAFPNGNISSVSEYSVFEAGKIYKLGFAVNGKKVRYTDRKGYISRIGVADDFRLFKLQMLLLSGF